MDEELKKKIEKREKMDTYLAYGLIVILLVCIVLVVLAKVNSDKKTANVPSTPTYIGLNEIATGFNNSSLNSGSEKVKASVVDNAIVITHTKDNNTFNYNIPMINSELEFTYLDSDPTDKKNFLDKLSKESAIIICKYYGNNEENCRKSAEKSSSSNQIGGIRYTKLDNKNTIYVNTTRSIEANDITIYNEVTKTNLNDTNYILNLLNYEISNVTINKETNKLTFNGVIKNTANSKSNLSVVVKLYDNNDTLLKENKLVFNEDKPLNESSKFNISFNLDSNFTIDKISKYSIEIVR